MLNKNEPTELQTQVECLLKKINETKFTSSEITELRRLLKEVSNAVVRAEKESMNDIEPIILDDDWKGVCFRDKIMRHAFLQENLTIQEEKLLMAIVNSRHYIKSERKSMYEILEVIKNMIINTNTINLTGFSFATFYSVFPTLIPKLIEFANIEAEKNKQNPIIIPTDTKN